MQLKMRAHFGLVILGGLLGCAGAKVGVIPSAEGGGGGGGGGKGGSSGVTIDLDAKAPTQPVQVDPGAAPVACDNPMACPDFPSAPINDPKSPSAIPGNPGSQFSGAPSGSGPCVTEPEDGALFPYNWTRPRIKWTGTSGLVQITVHADIEANDLVVYTSADNWIMDKTIWDGLRSHVHESDISVTVRASGGGATTVKFQIASASAAGSIVFWAADPSVVGVQNVTTVQDTTSLLRGFTVGEEGTVVTLKFSQVKQPSKEQSYNNRTPTCIGCHAATPDNGFVAFVDNWPWNSVISGIKSDNVGAELPSLSTGGLADSQQTVGRGTGLLECVLADRQSHDGDHFRAAERPLAMGDGQSETCQSGLLQSGFAHARPHALGRPRSRGSAWEAIRGHRPQRR